MDEPLRIYIISLLKEVDELIHLVDFHADWTGYFEFGDPLNAFIELRRQAERIHADLHVILTMLEMGVAELKVDGRGDGY